MPSKKGVEQALIWLKSKTHDKNNLDAINAELCINVIMDLQRQYEQLGIRYGALKSSKNDEKKDILKEEQLSFFEKGQLRT